MSEEQEKQESQKTLIAFVAGLLIGGLLVWVFSGPADDEASMDTETDSEITTETDLGTLDEIDVTDSEDMSTDEEVSTTDSESTPAMEMGDGSVEIADASAGSSVALESVTFPNDEGWVGVRSYSNNELGNLLGVVRFSKEQGLIPDMIYLQSPTTAGNEYAVVFFTESGDREFSLADDMQINGIAATFIAK